MAELKLVSPLLANMEVVSRISTRGAVSVYIVKSTKTAQTYILKHISVPESQKQVDALLFTGAAASEEEAQHYYEQVVSDYRQELETLESLSASPNLDCFRSYQIEPKEDGVGFDVYLLAEHRTTLSEYLSGNAVTHLCAVNLAMDLCSALVDLRAAGLVHRDVKPGNIYLNSQGHFVLGDLGIARIAELKYCSMPENMLSSYSAPELFSLVGTIEPTTDIYSVGLILYRIYNGNHAPFEDERTSAKAADKLRIMGKELPAPMYADYEMAEIIHKACAFQPADRYQDPAEMKDALVAYMKRNQLDDTLIVPPISGEHEPVDPGAEDEVEPVQFADSEAIEDDFKQNFSPDTQMLNDMIESVHKEMDRDPESYYNTLEPEEDDIPLDEQPKKRKRKKRSRVLPILTGVVLLLAIAAAVAYFGFIRPAVVHINAISLLDTSTDTISVFVDSNEADGAFDVLCTDSYGNQSRQSFAAGQETVFTGLTSGTQYTVSIDPLDKKRVTGADTLMATTIAQTGILSFTATTVTVTQAELNLIIQDGPDPGVWTVEYSADGVEPQTATFSGHSTVIAGLESNKDYTFTLQEPEGTRLTGQTKAYFSTVPAVKITGIKAALSSTTAILSWTIEGDAPAEWTVSISGPDGYSNEQTVASPTITFEGLTSGETYDVMISTPTMLENCSTKITPNVTKLTAFAAEEDVEANTLNFSWDCENEPADNEWQITARVHSDAADADLVQYTWTPEANTNSYKVDLATLLPETEYDFTLELLSGDRLEGENTASYTTPNKDKFREYGTRDFYVGLYLKPQSDTFTSKNLSVSRTSFTTAEFAAFALQSISNVQSSDDTVPYALVLTDADGKVLDAEFSSVVWKDVWSRNIFAGFFPRTPQTAGDYTLKIYFNYKFVAEKAFKVTES